MEKKTYEFIKDIERRIAAGERTEFWERNKVNIEKKKELKKKKLKPQKI